MKDVQDDQLYKLGKRTFLKNRTDKIPRKQQNLAKNKNLETPKDEEKHLKLQISFAQHLEILKKLFETNITNF
jgi:hypothetical protein